MTRDFTDYLNRFKKALAHLFHTRHSQDDWGQRRGIPPYVFNELSRLSPSEISIPEHYGGRGCQPEEIISVLEASSYESLPLSLVLGINGALFLEPLAKYGEDRLKSEVFSRFIKEKKLGGLMITEPDYGTDALGMQTRWQRTDTGYAVQGQKHWAGLSGWADYWLMTARENRNGSLKRDIDFFVCDSSDPDQFVKPVEAYRNLGLYMIPYALNEVDVRVPSFHRLIPPSSGIRLMQDLLHRSRMRFPGMAAGFIRRMLDEAAGHAQQRFVGGRALASYDQVQKRLADLQADTTIAAAFCRHSVLISSIKNDLSGAGLEANIHKTVMSDLMQNASQSLLQLTGAKGYRLNHIAGRSVVDSRPFQIFEGSNDVIYQQIADQFMKYFRKMREVRLRDALKNHVLTSGIADRLGSLTDFTPDPGMSQRKKVSFGMIISRIVGMEWVRQLGEGGYNPALTEQAIEALSERVQGLLGKFHGMAASSYIETAGRSDWSLTLS